MLKILTVGDPHLGRNPSFLKPGVWRKCVTDMLDAALANALRLKVHALVILGDVFDNNNPSPLDHAEFTDFVFKAKEEGVLVIVIPGNHDYIDSGADALEPYKRMRGMIKVINKPCTTKMQGVPVKFFPWSPPDVKTDFGAIKDKTPYLIFMHEEAKGSMMDNGWIADGFVPRPQDFLVGGHLHTYQLVGKRKRILYPGTALAGHWNHRTEGFTLLTARLKDGKLLVDHEQVPYEVPFKLREVPLAKFPLHKRDKIKTYYRLIVKPGEEIPDDKRIVSHKRLGNETRVDDAEATPTNGKRLDSLPNPKLWLVSQLPEAKRQRAMQILNSVENVTEEAA